MTLMGFKNLFIKRVGQINDRLWQPTKRKKAKGGEHKYEEETNHQVQYTKIIDSSTSSLSTLVRCVFFFSY